MKSFSSSNIILIGIMGVGKSTLGELIADSLNLQFYDTDEEIEKYEKKSISKIFEDNGEGYFRRIEQIVTLDLLQKERCVIAFGGGTFIDEKIRNMASKNSISVWLKEDINIILKRLSKNKKRPLIKNNPALVINKLINERYPIYNFADIKIDCNNENLKKIQSIIIEEIKNEF
ncbi:shikimate kinase [Hyphomicrobiales bacterium]|mgnify:FL=1|jgi:shikimate kinase|nr:shikimate kinase [Rhodobiaceae bacterium]MBT5640655.1 shikimate kinase [Rhodobiaceae bacterium]MBT6222327.1 shikimate kinase [Rhodobiaceae bacterium]MDB4128374.1 shikimate kinase [Hyphomicrobiales bacterium]|tara:strand:- start:105 stop:626 length:522 start_codon:yes stop_codon:yes gene_type:complete